MQKDSCKVWVLPRGSVGPAKGLAMPVELDPLDGLDQTMIHWTSRPGANPYWCYIQCEGCDVGWIWREKLGKGEPWTFKTWRESFWENGGWYYWNPVTKSRELDRQEGSHDHGPCQRAPNTAKEPILGLLEDPVQELLQQPFKNCSKKWKQAQRNLSNCDHTAVPISKSTCQS